MNIHKNARTTPQSRAMLINRVQVEGWPVAEVAMSLGVSERTIYKWLARFREEGTAGLQDRSSACRSHPHALAPAWVALVRMLRQSKLVAAEIAQRLRLARSTVSAVLRRIGLNRVSYLTPAEPVQRYEWERPGELVHVDIKRLGRFAQAGHRVTGKRTRKGHAGWEYVHVAIDDCSRFSYVEVLPDQKRYTTTRFWLRAVRAFARRGIRIQRVLSDNGGAYRSRPFRKACRWLGIATKRTRPYRPQTNGKAERFIQTLQRKWAYAVSYPTSEHRRAALPAWLQFYNEERPHAGIHQKTPLSKLRQLAEQRS